MKFKKKLISIVVVSLNTLNHTINTIKSIKRQSYKNYEILVIDGNSIDGTHQYLKRNSKSLFYLSEKDRGIYYAMNKGVKLAKSDWIIFLNSGDIFHNTKVLKNFSNLKNLNNYDVVFGNTVINYNFFLRFVRSKYINLITTKMPFCHQSVFCKTYLLKRKLFNTRYTIASDFNFFYDLYKEKKTFFHFEKNISKICTGGISDKKRFLCLKEYSDILIKNKSYLAVLLQTYDFVYYFVSFIAKKILVNRYVKLILKLKYKFKIN